ncbi:MAG: hemoglobin-like flavoprotein [Candidatus Azotimanducaceae bacterium]|jgi:hemoglobin-like flavoprotein
MGIPCHTKNNTFGRNGERMALTTREVSLIQSSFQEVVPIKAQAAEIFYDKLFQYDPALQPLFKTSMTTQGNMLMATLGVAVKGLNDLDALVPVLQDLAIRHIDYGVKVEDYSPVGNALLYALEQGLGPKFTPEVKQAWVKVYQVIAEVMRSAAYPNYDSGTFKNAKRYAKN